MDDLITLPELSLPDGTDVQALGYLLANHPSCIWERSDTTTRTGARISNLAKDIDPTIGTFITALKEKIESYISTKQPDPGHPFTAHIPESWDYSIWATILDQDGHQDPHLHPAAWVSGVYYLEVPEAITDPTNEAQSGWIEFSAPGYGITPVHPPIVRRISIAFHVIPTKWRK